MEEIEEKVENNIQLNDDIVQLNQYENVDFNLLNSSKMMNFMNLMQMNNDNNANIFNGNESNIFYKQENTENELLEKVEQFNETLGLIYDETCSLTINIPEKIEESQTEIEKQIKCEFEKLKTYLNTELDFIKELIRSKL